MCWVSKAIAILVLLLIAEMASFFIPILFVMMVVMVYMMMITELVRFLESILQSLLLLKKREESNRKLLRKMKIKKKTKFKKMYNANKSRWVHTKGNCTPRYLLSASVLKRRCLCRSKEGSIALQVLVLTLGVMPHLIRLLSQLTG